MASIFLHYLPFLLHFSFVSHYDLQNPSKSYGKLCLIEKNGLQIWIQGKNLILNLTIPLIKYIYFRIIYFMLRYQFLPIPLFSIWTWNVKFSHIFSYNSITKFKIKVTLQNPNQASIFLHYPPLLFYIILVRVELAISFQNIWKSVGFWEKMDARSGISRATLS